MVGRRIWSYTLEGEVEENEETVEALVELEESKWTCCGVSVKAPSCSSSATCSDLSSATCFWKEANSVSRSGENRVALM